MDFLIAAFRSLELLLACAWTLFSGYLFLLTIVAAGSHVRKIARRTPSTGKNRFALLIPAHNEEAGIGATIAGLMRQSYPRELYEIVVIADNCTDRTGEIALERGVTVFERHDDLRRGKGYALAWAFELLLGCRPEVDAYVVLDADSQASPNLLEVLDEMIADGREAVQVYDAVMNPGKSWLTSVRYASFAGYSYVRPLGRTGLGFSAKLQGNGMCLTAKLLCRHPWSSFGLAEDTAYSCLLVSEGVSIYFTAEAEVLSEMPSNMDEMTTQLKRWEHGRLQNLLHYVPILLKSAARKWHLPAAEAALEMLIPPLSLVIAVPFVFFLLNFASVLFGISSSTFPAYMLLRWGGVLVMGLAHLLGALMLVRAPSYVYIALLASPVYLARLIKVNLEYIFGRGETRWVRSARSPKKKEP